MPISNATADANADNQNILSMTFDNTINALITITINYYLLSCYCLVPELVDVFPEIKHSPPYTVKMELDKMQVGVLLQRVPVDSQQGGRVIDAVPLVGYRIGILHRKHTPLDLRT